MNQDIDISSDHITRVLCRWERRNLIARFQPPSATNMAPTIGQKKVSESSPVVEKRLYDWFDRVVVINLDRRQDRWKHFQHHLAETGWPFRWPERFRAVDGQTVKPPAWWGAGAGAWGCHQSHLRVIEQALMDGVQSLLVMEDDACLTHDFSQRVGPFLRSLPTDWDQIYLGGQHLFRKQNPPVPINKHVLSVYNVNRTHAYAVTRPFMQHLYQHLTNYPDHAKHPKHHVDHRMGALHQLKNNEVYAPDRWLIGQANSHSNIKGKTMPQRFWNGHKQNQFHTQTQLNQERGFHVAVVGPYRSGTSCLAGVLHCLGGFIGNDNRRGNHNNPKGFYESISLATSCRALYREPSLKPKSTQDQRIQVLRKWKTSQGQNHTFSIAKHPLLCLMCHEMSEAWGNGTKYIGIYRPIDDSLASLNRAGWWKPSQRQPALEGLWQARDAGLAERSHLRLNYYDLLSTPALEIDRIIDYLQIMPTEQQRADAIAFVEPSLNHCVQGIVA